jgi:hypothetical protein
VIGIAIIQEDPVKTTRSRFYCFAIVKFAYDFIASFYENNFPRHFLEPNLNLESILLALSWLEIQCVFIITPSDNFRFAILFKFC